MQTERIPVGGGITSVDTSIIETAGFEDAANHEEVVAGISVVRGGDGTGEASEEEVEEQERGEER